MKAQLQLAARRRGEGATDEAFETVQRVLLASPDQIEALVLAAQIQRDLGEYAEAADLVARAADLNESGAAGLLLFAFECDLKGGRFGEAESSLKKIVEIAPDDPTGYRYLGQLLNAQGRRWEASRYVRELIRLRVIRPNELLSLIDLRGPFDLASFEEFVDSDRPSLFSLGKLRLRYSTERGLPDDFLRELELVMEAFPNSETASAFRCRILADSDQYDELREALENTPEGASDEPEYWYAVGMLLSQEKQYPEAVRAFSEALARDPTDRESLRSMIACFVSMNRNEEVLQLRDRLGELDRIFRLARDADPEQAVWISGALQSQVRPWESTAWLMQAARISGDVRSIIPELDRRHAEITRWQSTGTPDQLVNARLKQVLGFGRDRWPLPDLKHLPSAERSDRDATPGVPLRFNDVAMQVGIDVPYVSGFPMDGSEFTPYQVNGAGLAAFDYDLDGRCDLYVMQSGGDPVQPGSSSANQLFRLVNSEQFEDVSQVSKTQDRRFGQGVCAGDVNQDGFPDLLMANIGSNGIYLNQGDGTFAPADERLLGNEFAWTSSIALADLNGDHLPEVFEVNYVDDDRAYTLRCRQNYLDCQPQAFGKGQDRVLRARPDGVFEPWQEFTEASPTPRLGFGLVIANFDGAEGNDVFISNDGDFNHFWTSVRTAVDESKSQSGRASDDRYVLSEAANIRGCSLGRGGRSQACMGIASGDFDRNGALDLHVTNFRQEPVNLFLQSDSGVFVDQAAAYGLAKPSFGVLGFGTQSADLDNDGWLDLAVLNGHVYDARFEGTPFQMRPQLFRGGREGFTTEAPDSAGDYWQEEAVGRTLVALDWNRDGGIDWVANHLDRPLALLQNESTRGNWVQFELVGVRSERDAIGARVRVTSGEETWTQWQVGGDGLMCSNEAILHFGLGETARVDSVEVLWPSGAAQTVSIEDLGKRYLLIEGHRSAEPH